MTVTDARWWAPAEPGIGPDDFDLELLEPGDDPVADLGQAFLALHRVGAAACEAVATQPLADEDALAFALANARKLVAPEASEIISKSVGDNVNYGNLLLRDVLDDAEATALSLWRSCIAKNVPAATTAKRVGMVYGLPPGDLFHFQKLATDVKANPVALQEAADKALFTHVAKLVTEEAVERKVEISKAPPPRARRERWWEEEPRDETGEWAESPERLGDIQPAAPPVAPRRAQRAQRAQRARRAERAEVTEAATASATESVGVSVGESVGEGVSASALLSVGGPAGELLGGRPDNPNFDPSNRSRVPRTPPDPTKPYLTADRNDEFIDAPLSFVMPSDEWQAFLRDAGTGERGKTFYAGRLQEYIGAPTVWRDDSDLTTKEHEDLISQVAAKVQRDEDIQAQPPPRAYRIPILTRKITDDEIADVTMNWLRKEFKMSELEASQEMLHVDYVSDLHDPKNSIYAVYAPRTRGKPRDADRPIAQVTEVVVDNEQENVFGQYQNGRYSISRHLAFTTSGPFASGRNRRFWDEQNRVIRNVVKVRRTDEEVNKALSPRRFHQLEEEGRIHRDETGQFAAGEEEVVALAPPTRARRAQRAQRARRTARPDLAARPAEDARESVGEGVGERVGAAARASVAESVTHPRISTPDDPDLLEFQDDYHSVVPAHVDLGLGFRRKAPNQEARREIDRPGEARGDEIHTHIAGVTIDKFNDHGGREVMVFHDNRATVEDLADLAAKIHTEMGKDLNYTLARVRMELRPDGTANVEVYRNQRPLGPVDVVRWEQANKIRPYHLYPDEQGRYQTEKTIKYWLEQAWDSAENADNHIDDKQLANPWVRVWRAEQF